MNIKRISVIFIASLMLILTAGAIWASEDVGINETLVSQIDSTALGNASADSQIQDEGNEIHENVAAPIKTKVKADQKAAVYKKNSYFGIKVQDNKNALLSNVALKVTVKSGKTVKIFNIKTNSKGVAKFNTKGLKIGVHKVSVKSADGKHKVSKSSKLFVGKQYTAVVRFGHIKVLKNKEKIRIKVKYDNDAGKEVSIAFTKKSAHTKILKAKFTFYNKKTKKFFSKMEYSKFKNGKWHWPDKDYSFKSLIYKAKVYYISTRKC